MSLSLTGTGSDSDYAILGSMPALQSLHFSGKFTLTNERLCMLGSQPELRFLKFDNVFFPHTLYKDYTCKTATFHHLSLELLMSDPSHPSRQQGFLKAGLRNLKSLKHFAIHVDCCPLIYVTLGTLPTLHDVTVLHETPFHSPLAMALINLLGRWEAWAHSKVKHIVLL